MQKISTKSLVVNAFSYLKKYYLKEIVILILILIRNAGALSFPFFLKIIIDDVYPKSDFDLLLKILGIIVAIQLASMVASIVVSYLIQQVSNGIMEDLKTELFEHVIHLPIDFYNKNDIGEVVHSMSNEVNVLRRFLTTSMIELANNLIMIISISIVLYLLNPYLFMVCIMVIPVILLVMIFFHSKMRVYIAMDRQADASVLSFMMEKLDNVLLIKLYNQYKFEVSGLVERIREYMKVNLKATYISAQGTQISAFLIAMGPILVIAVGSKGIFEGFLTLGTLIAFIEYFNLMIQPARGTVSLYYMALRAMESMYNISTFSQMEVPDKPKIKAVAPQKIHKITCNDVQLAFDETEVLKKVDLVFEKGKSYGFVGGSGSGKSSLMFLLAGLYKPTRGEILINTEDANDLGIYAITERIALVRSNTKLVKGTIRENMLYGQKEIDDPALTSILEVVGLADYIDELPEKLETNISDLGTKLSDGQRQRLSLARALLRDSEVLILDEATSAMDSIKETEVLENIQALYKDRILIVISHRLSSIQSMNEIICLEDGIIVEQNNHENLLENKGAYWKLFEKQLIPQI